MAEPAAAQAAADAQRQYWGRVLGATLRMARDLDIAEEATADAFVLALQTWPERGVPDSVEAWLLTAARRRAIDRIRRLGRFRERLAMIAATGDLTAGAADAGIDGPPVLDDELRLVVLCCHPALDVETQVALTMRLGCGVPTASIAAAFLVPEPTMAARLTRAKKRIAGSGTGIELPDDVAVEERMPAVRRTIHLAYTMGHTAGSGGELRDDDLAAHAVAPRPRAARAAARRHRGRRAAGADPADRGPRRHPPRSPTATQVLLADADRSRVGPRPARRGSGSGRRPPFCPAKPARSGRDRRTDAGPLVLQAAIAAEHARAATFADTDWAAIVACYDALLTIEPSPTIAIGRCVALSYLARRGGRAGRPRRGHRGRRLDALPVRPRRPGPDARAARAVRRGRRGVVGRGRRAPGRTPSGRSSRLGA